MENKKVDNTIINQTQPKKDLENLIDWEKKKINQLNDMQDNAVSLHKNINRCVDLLSKSINGPTTKNTLNSIYENNKKIYTNIVSQIDEITKSSIKSINKLSQDKEQLEKEEKNNRGDNSANNSN